MQNISRSSFVDAKVTCHTLVAHVTSLVWWFDFRNIHPVYPGTPLRAVSPNLVALETLTGPDRADALKKLRHFTKSTMVGQYSPG